MSEEKNTQENKVAQAVAGSVYGGVAKTKDGQNNNRRFGGSRRQHKVDDFDQRTLDIARVTRVMKGGKRMSFRACIAVGDKKGSIGIGLGKGADVSLAINKAVNQAKKDMVFVSVINETIPHEVRYSLGASKLLFKPARQGKGVIAGGVVRVILELAGVKNITAKILGGKNKINNARCTLAALASLRKVTPKPEKKLVEKEIPKIVTATKPIVKKEKK